MNRNCGSSSVNPGTILKMFDCGSINHIYHNTCAEEEQTQRMVAQPNDGDGSKKSFARSAYAIFARMPMVDHNTNDVNVMKAFNAVCFHILTTALGLVRRNQW